MTEQKKKKLKFTEFRKFRYKYFYGNFYLVSIKNFKKTNSFFKRKRVPSSSNNLIYTKSNSFYLSKLQSKLGIVIPKREKSGRNNKIKLNQIKFNQKKKGKSLFQKNKEKIQKQRNKISKLN